MVKKVKIQMIVENDDGSDEFVFQCYSDNDSCQFRGSVANSAFALKIFNRLSPSIISSLETGSMRNAQLKSSEGTEASNVVIPQPINPKVKH